MILTSDEVKEFLHIDWEEPSLSLYMQVAEEYIKDAIENYDVKINNERFQRKAKLCALVLINEMYSNREMITDKPEKYKFIVSSLMMQMKYCTFE